MSDIKKYCEDCGNLMTLLLYSYVCDWCDGIEEEWEDSSKKVTEPYGHSGYGLYSDSGDGGFIILDYDPTHDYDEDYDDLINDYLSLRSCKKSYWYRYI